MCIVKYSIKMRRIPTINRYMGFLEVTNKPVLYFIILEWHHGSRQVEGHLVVSVTSLVMQVAFQFSYDHLSNISSLSVKRFPSRMSLPIVGQAIPELV